MRKVHVLSGDSATAAARVGELSRHSFRLTTTDSQLDLTLPHRYHTICRNTKAPSKPLQPITEPTLCSQPPRLTKAPVTKRPRATSRPTEQHRNVRLTSAQRAQAQQQRQARPPRRSSRRKGTSRAPTQPTHPSLTNAPHSPPSSSASSTTPSNPTKSPQSAPPS
jgi:hypothetical protein